MKPEAWGAFLWSVAQWGGRNASRALLEPVVDLFRSFLKLLRKWSPVILPALANAFRRRMQTVSTVGWLIAGCVAFDVERTSTWRNCDGILETFTYEDWRKQNADKSTPADT